jgi:hypothetical protein
MMPNNLMFCLPAVTMLELVAADPGTGDYAGNQVWTWLVPQALAQGSAGQLGVRSSSLRCAISGVAGAAVAKAAMQGSQRVCTATSAA